MNDLQHMNASPVTARNKARHNMVESQIRTNKVINPELIAALSLVARENFVPTGLRDVAYLDEDLPIGHGRYLLEPMIFARLLESAEFSPSDRVLDFGCGCGYSTAILSHLVDDVQPVDWQADFINLATENLAKSGRNTQKPILINLPSVTASQSVQTSLSELPELTELTERGLFDVIISEVAMSEIPFYLLNLLSPNGRLIGIERKSPRIGVGHAILVERIHQVQNQNSVHNAAIKPGTGAFSRRVLFDAAAPLLPEFMPVAEFQF